MQLRMTLAELGMSSVPSLLPIPRIAEAIDEHGVAQLPVVNRSANRFLDEFLWYASALAGALAPTGRHTSSDTAGALKP